jgi:lysophospholipase L1-like esterase
MTGEKAGAVALPSLWCKKLKQVGLYKTGLAAASLFGGYCLGELLYVAVNTPRLPEAPGPVLGGSSRTSASSKSIRLLCLGDSVAAGCGLQSNDEACAGVFARATSEALGGRDVTWRVLARNGYTANRIERKHVPRIGSFDPDLVLLSVGVNNLLAMQSSAVFENELTSLLRSIRRSVPAHASVVVMGMPPMSMFVALTPLLRVYAGHKAKQFNEVMAKVCNNLQRELEQEEEEESQDSRFKQIVHIDYQGTFWDTSISL